jgi:transposase-like protein
MNSPKSVDQLDAEIRALQAQREAALVASKEADLETVKRLCKQHGFTATQLRGVLKTRAKNKKADDETAATKPTTTKKPVAAKKK